MVLTAEASKDVCERSAAEQVLLLESELLALPVLVVGVENTSLRSELRPPSHSQSSRPTERQRHSVRSSQLCTSEKCDITAHTIKSIQVEARDGLCAPKTNGRNAAGQQSRIPRHHPLFGPKAGDRNVGSDGKNFLAT